MGVELLYLQPSHQPASCEDGVRWCVDAPACVRPVCVPSVPTSPSSSHFSCSRDQIRALCSAASGPSHWVPLVLYHLRGSFSLPCQRVLESRYQPETRLPLPGLLGRYLPFLPPRNSDSLTFVTCFLDGELFESRLSLFPFPFWTQSFLRAEASSLSSLQPLFLGLLQSHE